MTNLSFFLDTTLQSTIKKVTTTTLCALICACGGGAGDDTTPLTNNAAIVALDPVVGVWQLPADWRGGNDESYLVVRQPGTDGVAEAVIFDQDPNQNCFDRNGFEGTAEQSLTNDIFLSVTALPSAVLDLQPSGALEVSVFSEAAGTDAAAEQVFTASRLGITETGIQLCS